MRYHNLDPRHRRHGPWAVLRWSVLDRLTGRRRTAPPGPAAPRIAPDLDLIQDAHGLPRLTWLGHASFLVQLGGANVLIDPVFSERVGWRYARHAPPGLTPEQLPPIHLVLVTHGHLDHLDLPSLDALPRTATVLTARGLGSIFCRRQFVRIIELDWWDSVDIGALQVTFTPARHWSRRTLFDGNRSLWGGFVVHAEDASVYCAGDTAWFDGFAEIARRFPDLDAALIPIGGYTPAWFMEHHHLNPEQAGQAFLDTGARLLVPMHWGTFQMTDEPLCEPIERLRAWWKTAAIPDGRRLAVPAVGETVMLSGVRDSAGAIR